MNGFCKGDRVEIATGYDSRWDGPGVVSDGYGDSILVTKDTGEKGYFSADELLRRAEPALVEVETTRTIRIFGRWITEAEARQLLRELDEVLS